MLKPDEKVKNDEVVVEGDEETTATPEEVELAVDEKGEVKSPEETKKLQEEEAQKQEEEKRKKNTEFAQRRLDQEKRQLRQQLEESNRRIAELERHTNQATSFGPRPATAPVAKDNAYWEKRLAEDPTPALREFYKELYKEERQKELQAQVEMDERQKMIDSFNATLEDSKTMALEEYPSLEDESSPEYSMFMEILEKNPSWRNSPLGPMKVVREMRKTMNTGGGDDVMSKVKADAEKAERARQTRIVNQPLENRRPATAGSKIVLTREQVAVAKEMGIPLDKYAAMVKRTSGNTEGGVTI